VPLHHLPKAGSVDRDPILDSRTASQAKTGFAANVCLTLELSSAILTLDRDIDTGQRQPTLVDHLHDEIGICDRRGTRLRLLKHEQNGQADSVHRSTSAPLSDPTPV
jgi:hypothetical protein